MQSKECLLVVGMGRSGTSVISSSLMKLGFFGGAEASLIGPDEGNPDGYYEHDPIAKLNDQIRTNLGMKYDICLGCPEDWLQYENLRALTAQLGRLIQSTFGDRSPWVLKDPRISLLLPIYEHVLSELGVRPTLVLCVRNPLNAAESFHRKFGPPVRWAVAMWLQHTLSVLEAARRLPCRVVSYEGFLGNSMAALKPILDLFPTMEPSQEAVDALPAMSKDNFNHGSQGDAALESLRPSAIKRTYELCLKAAAEPAALEDGGFSEEITELWDEFQAWWSFPPYEKVLASRLRLTYSANGRAESPEIIYSPKRKPQTFEIPFDAPFGAPVEGKISDWPGIVFVRDVHLRDAAGNRTPINLERATDISSAAHPEGEVWTLPRVGNHFRFIAPGGKYVFSITFSIIAEPIEAARLASESWLECLALKRRVAELEAAVRQV